MLGKNTAVLVSGLLLLNCGSNATVDDKDVNENKIEQEYDVAFNQQERSLDLFAQFRLGNSSGTTIRLTSPGNIKVNGQMMVLTDGDANPINLIGSYYRMHFTKETPEESYEFTWERNDGMSMKNILSMNMSTAILEPTQDIEIKRSEDLVVKISKKNSLDIDTISMSIDVENPAPEGKINFLTKNFSEKDTIKIPAEQLSNLVSGPAEISLEMVRRAPIQQGNPGYGGVLRSIYRSKVVAVIFVD